MKNLLIQTLVLNLAQLTKMEIVWPLVVILKYLMTIVLNHVFWIRVVIVYLFALLLCFNIIRNVLIQFLTIILLKQV